MDFFDRVQIITERYLTHRNRIRRIKREKRKAKNVILDWIEAFLWAACMVLLLNQYLVQAYRIPSGSMIDTLNIGDHVFVNKIVYGPELLPGFFKLPSPVKPERNDIIIFENPTYISRGTVFDVAQRIIYMLTLTMVDIDKDESGEPRVHFLIKRAAGHSGDRIKIKDGELIFCFAGETRWVSERDYNDKRGWNHNITKILNDEHYRGISAAAKEDAWRNRGFQVSPKLQEQASSYRHFRFYDSITFEKEWYETLRKAAPANTRYTMLYAKHYLGWYVPEGRVFPVGDSRDNSRDGRSFGPVRMSKVLGKGLIVYWPLRRFGPMI